MSQVMSDTGIQYAQWAQAMNRSELYQIMGQLARPNLISFALGLPDTALFPLKAYLNAATAALVRDTAVLQYMAPCRDLKAHIVKLMAQRGVVCTEEQIFLTTGAQQGMSLLARLLLNDKGSVLTEEITYEGIITVVKPFQPTILTVPTDTNTGIDVDGVEALLTGGARPAFLYVMAEGHNPLGSSMPMEKRIRLVELARRYNMPILEDDAYGFLYYQESVLPALRALDERNVFYIGSFSKILAPALRVGWLVVPAEMIERLSFIKQANDLNISNVTQVAVCAFMDAGHMDGHLSMLRAEYRRRRDTMLAALGDHLPASAKWTTPQSGMFVWVELPDRVINSELLKTALETEQVAFIPGQVLSLRAGGAAHCLRLNFSNLSPPQICEGIARLGRIVANAHWHNFDRSIDYEYRPASH